ncbi:MAG: aminotransferase class V-fold PLP-dependent enzyme [Acetanaerobacterium sp.]
MTYFDNAATTMPKPASVMRAIRECAEYYGANPGRSGHRLSMQTAKKVFECREQAAKLFDAEPENVVFTQNCTQALNIALKGALGYGSHVIISDLEHNSVFRPIYRLSQDGGVSYSIAEVFEGDFDRTIRAFEDQITSKTRMIACTAGSNLCGVMLPCEGLYELCQRHGLLLLLDLAQSAGVRRASLSKADFLCMPGHKGLYGPPGTGMLITSSAGEGIATIMEGGTGSQSYLKEQPNVMPDRLESGTLNTYGIMGLNEGMQFVSAMGCDRIYRHELALAQTLYDSLVRVKGIRLYTGRPEWGTHLPVICFNLGEAKSETVVEELSARGFALRGGYHCAPLAHHKLKTGDYGAVRASFSVYNTQEQVLHLVHEIKRLQKTT